MTVRLGRRSYPGRGRIVTDPAEDRLARDLVFGKYSQRYSDDLEEWRETAPRASPGGAGRGYWSSRWRTVPSGLTRLAYSRPSPQGPV